MNTKHLFAASICLAILSTLAHGISSGAEESAPAGYRVPPGWRMQIAASEPLVINPVTMTFATDGRLFLSEWMPGGGPNDRIRVLADRDGDGTFDDSRIYIDKLDMPAGILFWDGWTYITLNHEVVRLRDKDGDGKLETRETIAKGFGNDNSHHRVSGLMLGPDGWLYMTTGDSDAHAEGSDGSRATVLRSGGVFRCKPDGSKIENFAFGMRNPWGNVSFDDRFQIFHTDNDNEGSPGFTGCRILHVVERGDYGWRLREGARCCAPDFQRATWNGGRPGRLGWVCETGRGAPAGLCVLNSQAFPDRLRNLLVYPDVFRKLVRAYVVKPAGSTYTLDHEFELLGSDDGLFRPNDAEVGPDGALYILDWRTDSGGAGQLSGNAKTGRIYRMTWAGTAQEPARPTFPRDRLATLAKANDSDLTQSLKSEDFGLRRTATLEILRRGVSNVDSLGELSVDRTQPSPARRHAIWILAMHKKDLQASLWREWLRDPDASNRRLAYEAISRHDTLGSYAELILHATPKESERDARVVRAKLLALGRVGRLLLQERGEEESVRSEVASIPARLLVYLRPDAGSDPFLRDAAIRGLEDLGPLGVEAVATAITNGKTSPEKEAGLYALAGWRTKDALKSILDLATSKDNIRAESRAALFHALRELILDVPPDRIATWVRDSQDVDVLARIEGVRLLEAMGPRAFAAAGPLAPKLLADPNPKLRASAIDLAKVFTSNEARDLLLQLLGLDTTPIDEKRSLVSALESYHAPIVGKTLAKVYDTTSDHALRGELLRGLAATDFNAAAQRAEKLLGEKDRDLRLDAIRLLGQTPDSAILVAKAFNAGTIPSADLPQVIECLRRHATPELQAETQKLLKNKLLAAPQGEDARKLRAYVSSHGDPNKGRGIYLDPKKANCVSCHRMEGGGGSVGPDLTRVWQTLSFEKRLESIVEPSKEIKEGYNTYKVATKDGRVLTGLLVAETPEALTLKDSEGRETRIPKPEIEQRGVDPTSLMPAGVAGNLNFAELADLLAFLGDQKAQEELRAKPR